MVKQRTYLEDGKEYIFNNYAFKQEANRVLQERKESREKISVFDFESEIGEYVCRSQDSVKKWKHKGSSPSDLDMVKKLAEFLKVDYHKLLVELKVKEVEKMEEIKVNENQTEKDIVKAICIGLMDYVIHIGDINKAEMGLLDSAYTYSFSPLFKMLNMSIFEISEDTYLKLRRLIAEVQFALEDSFDYEYRKAVLRWGDISKTYVKLLTAEGPHPAFCDLESVGDIWYDIEYSQAYGPFFIKEEMGAEISDYYKEILNNITDQEAIDSYSRLMVSVFVEVLRHDFPEYFPK